ncbi:MAG: orotidine-5'-phosphate decarboxylase [bacterium]|nr:orotidine-5'-phosphate decarboxylase [bacterium]
MDRNFRAMLTERQKKVNSLLCVGLDPLVEKIPEEFWKMKPVETVVFIWMKAIVDVTAPFASMFKFQRAHWEAISGGIGAMRQLIAYIHLQYPDIPVFLDCKRGDIDRTQRQYREAHFTLDGVDGMNYNGYMGKDTLRSLVDKEHLGRALVGLGRTSNPEAWEIQNLEVHQYMRQPHALWEVMVERIVAWSEEFGVLENAGVVMGAAYKSMKKDSEEIVSYHLERARELVGNKLWFLIPGIGKQGGAVEETVRASYRGPGSIAINSSSDIDFASAGPDFAEASARVAEKTRDALNKGIPKGQ